MKIAREEVEYVAGLARLKFREEDIELFTHQLNAILDYIDKLNELDTSGVKPTSHAIDINNAFRPDEVRPSVGQERSLANAPAKDKGAFVVPRVI